MKKFIALILSCLMLSAACAEPVQKTVLAFEGNPTTGFEWTAFVAGGDAVQLGETEYVEDEHEANACGYGGTYYFDILAVQPGEAIVTFTYARSWETLGAFQRVWLFRVDEDLNISSTDVTDESIVTGTVTGILEDGVVIVTAEGEELIVLIDTDTMPVLDENILVYTDGTVMMSEPAQVVALGWETVNGEEAR